MRDFQEGRRAHAEGRLEEAELSYLRAWSRMKSYDIATNLGQVQLKLNKPVSAAKHLAFGLRTVGPEVEPERLEVMEALLAEAKAQVGTLRVRAMNVAEVEVYLDGERVPEEAARHELYLEPGEHVLLMRHAGYEDAVLRVITGPGLTETIAHRLKPKAEKAPGAGAAGAPAAAGPQAANDAPPAKLPETTAAPREARSWVPVIALGAASAVGLGLGVGFTVAANAASADVDRQTQEIHGAGGQCAKPTDAFAARCAELHRTGTRADTFGNGARVAYVAAGALAIATVGYVMWPPREPSGPAGVRARIGVLRDGMGVGVVGVW
ncbi:PEGA domain-containing protein [Sorangium sp. So ce1024]|uniref:PEGA domain-containing protein n=1 Tax=Sorangium sp. So ce1024 TaxID=3133327 RepID=UPI003F041EE1